MEKETPIDPVYTIYSDGAHPQSGVVSWIAVCGEHGETKSVHVQVYPDRRSPMTFMARIDDIRSMVIEHAS